jgi:acyl-CoA thioesterase
VTPAGDGRFDVDIRQEWWGGGGPHGGYMAALVLRAMIAAVDDPVRPPRSATLHFLAPPDAGSGTVTVTTERAGRSLTSVSARLEQEGVVKIIALGAFSGPWEALEHPGSERPPARAWDEVDPAELGPVGNIAPQFFSHVELRPTLGGDRDDVNPLTGGWMRLRPPEPLDAPAAAFLLDAWWPAVYALLDHPAGAPTIEYTIHFRRALPATADDEPVLARLATSLVHEGFFAEDGELWSADGRLLVQSRQLALLRDR